MLAARSCISRVYGSCVKVDLFHSELLVTISGLHSSRGQHRDDLRHLVTVPLFLESHVGSKIWVLPEYLILHKFLMLIILFLTIIIAMLLEMLLLFEGA